MILSKIISSRGFCSKRKAEDLVKKGEITVDKKVIKDVFFIPKKDSVIEHNGKKITPLREKIWLYNKPEKTIVSHNDKRTTVFDLIQEQLKVDHKLISVGRLDYMSKGLMIITNSSEYAHYMETASLKRVYRVVIKSKKNTFNSEHCMMLRKGIKAYGIQYKPIHAKIIYAKKDKYTVDMTLVEGKNREIRNIIKYFGFFVESLERIKYGGFDLSGIKSNQIVKVK